MFRSKPCMKSSVFAAASALAIEPNRCMTSSWGLACSASAMSMPAARSLGAVARIDLNVLLCQIAGAEASGALAAAANRKLDRALRLVKPALQVLFIEVGCNPALAHRGLLQPDVHARAIEFRARVARRGEN